MGVFQEKMLDCARIPESIWLTEREPNSLEYAYVSPLQGSPKIEGPPLLESCRELVPLPVLLGKFSSVSFASPSE